MIELFMIRLTCAARPTLSIKISIIVQEIEFLRHGKQIKFMEDDEEKDGTSCCLPVEFCCCCSVFPTCRYLPSFCDNASDLSKHEEFHWIRSAISAVDKVDEGNSGRRE